MRLNSVENAAVRKMDVSSLLPATKHVIDGEQFEGWKLHRIPGGYPLIARTIIVSSCYFLCLQCVEIIDVSSAHVTRSIPGGNITYYTHSGFGQDREGGGNDLKFVSTMLFDDQVGFILPNQQHIPSAAFDESRY